MAFCWEPEPERIAFASPGKQCKVQQGRPGHGRLAYSAWTPTCTSTCTGTLLNGLSAGSLTHDIHTIQRTSMHKSSTHLHVHLDRRQVLDRSGCGDREGVVARDRLRGEGQRRGPRVRDAAHQTWSSVVGPGRTATAAASRTLHSTWYYLFAFKRSVFTILMDPLCATDACPPAACVWRSGRPHPSGWK